jgi:hypothetical protein
MKPAITPFTLKELGITKEEAEERFGMELQVAEPDPNERVILICPSGKEMPFFERPLQSKVGPCGVCGGDLIYHPASPTNVIRICGDCVRTLGKASLARKN